MSTKTDSINSPTKSLKLTPRPQYAKNGYRYDLRATAMMVEDLLFDPVLAAKVILNIDVPPHQELRLLMMWVHGMTIDDSGFSSGKTHTAAMVISLRSVLMRDRVSGVISKSYRQGKFILDAIDGWQRNNKLFRNTIQTYNGRPRIVRDTEVHRIHWRGGSELRVLPPGWIKNAEGLRGERWNDGYADEWNTYDNITASFITLTGRVTKKNDYFDCPVKQNHFHLFSTPGYKHDASYKIIESVDKDIKGGNHDSAHFTSNYRHVPRIKKFRGMVDLKRIRFMQIHSTKGEGKREIDGEWQDDSQTYYSSLYINKAKELWNPGIHKILIQRFHESDVYLCAFDMARGSTNRQEVKGDDFCFVVYRLPAGEESPYPCYAFRKNGVKASEAAAMIHKYHRAFQFSFVAYDVGGGGMFVYDELIKREHRIDGVTEQVSPLLHIEDQSSMVGDRIVMAIRRASDFIKHSWGVMASDNVLLNRLHNYMKQALENDTIPLPPDFEIFALENLEDVDEIREWLEKSHLSETDKAAAELALMVVQLGKVDTLRDQASGMPIKDSKGMFNFGSREKKDLAYSLVYVNGLYEIYKRMKELGVILDSKKSDISYYASARPL